MKLFYAFVNLEKDFDQVPRKAIYKEDYEYLIKDAMSLYRGCEICVEAYLGLRRTSMLENFC